MRQFRSLDAAIINPSRPLRLSANVAEGIRSASFDGLKSLPRRGAEIGGIILADPAAADQGAEICVVGCEHRFGPSYRLSPNDLVRLRAAKTQCEAAGRKAVAYFRSSTRGEMRVEPEDEQALRDACTGVEAIVLAAPSMSGAARVRVFSRDSQGKWVSGEEFRVLPAFDARPVELAAVDEPEAAGVGAAEERPPASLAPLRRNDPEPPKTVSRPQQEYLNGLWDKQARRVERNERWARLFKEADRRAVRYAAGVVAVAAIAFVLSRTGGPNRFLFVVPHPKLGLAVRAEGGALHVTWNGASAAAKSAVQGALEILDSDSPSTVRLQTSDIHEGSILYTPHSPDVTFRLGLRDAQSRYTEEMIRVLGATAASPPVAKQPAPQNTAAPQASAAPPAPARAADSVSAVWTGQPAQPKRPAERPEPPVDDDVPQIGPRPIPGAQEARAPAVPAAETASGGAGGELASGKSAERVPQAPPEATPLRPRPDPVPSPAGPVPPPASVAPAVTPPAPLVRVQPSSLGRRGLSAPSTTKISVIVSVDPTGRVAGARLGDDSRGKDQFLAGLCIQAARQWKFRPASRGGKSVASDYRIDFVFSPAAY